MIDMPDNKMTVDDYKRLLDKIGLSLYEAPVGVELLEVVIPIEPMGAVRENKNTKWGSGAAAKKANEYHAWKHSVQVLWIQAMLKLKLPKDTIPLGVIHSFEFGLSIPNPDVKSLSKVKRQERLDLIGTPHKKKPDWDNLCKAFIDALYYKKDIDDGSIWKVSAGIEKVYTAYGKGYVKIVFPIIKK